MVTDMVDHFTVHVEMLFRGMLALWLSVPRNSKATSMPGIALEFDFSPATITSIEASTTQVLQRNCIGEVSL
jgi:hypothetical protein